MSSRSSVPFDSVDKRARGVELVYLFYSVLVESKRSIFVLSWQLLGPRPRNQTLFGME